MAHVGVVVPVLNQHQKALDALWSVQTQYDWQPYIIPNWRQGWSVAQSWNYGIERALSDGCSFVLVINDDVVLSPWTIDKQIERLENNDDGIILTTGWATGDGRNALAMAEWPEPETNTFVQGADFACFMMTPFCWDNVGRFDENFKPAYFEDNDYHRRIYMGGYLAQIVIQAPYFHYGSSSGGVHGPEYDHNKQYFKKKWGGRPGAETFSTPFDDPTKTIKDW